MEIHLKRSSKDSLSIFTTPYYELLFGKECTSGVPTNAICEHWPREKGDADGKKWGNGDRSLRINLEKLILMQNIIKGETIMVEHEVQQEFYKCKLPQKLSKGDGLARQCP